MAGNTPKTRRSNSIKVQANKKKKKRTLYRTKNNNRTYAKIAAEAAKKTIEKAIEDGVLFHVDERGKKRSDFFIFYFTFPHVLMADPELEDDYLHCLKKTITSECTGPLRRPVICLETKRQSNETKDKKKKERVRCSRTPLFSKRSGNCA